MTNSREEIITNSKDATQKAGEEIAVKLHGGEILALHGDLGSGKTTFVQGLAKGLGIRSKIISPTFIIIRRYEISIKYKVSNIKYFYHIDLYRVEGERDLQEIGIDEIINDPDNIVAIEWAERMGSLLPEKRVDIKFEYVDEEKRRIIIVQDQKSKIKDQSLAKK